MHLVPLPVTRAGLIAGIALLGLWPVANAQTTTAPADDAASEKQKEKVVEMSPFKVTTDRDKGYKATNATAGTRLNAEIKDLPLPLTVITEQFLRDTGSSDLRQSLRYTAGIVLQSQNDQGTPGGAYQGPGGVNNPEGASANKTQTSYKIRGYVTDAVLRDGFRRQNSTDSINIGRIEVAFGPTAILYGIGSFGGIVNYIPKAPQAKPYTEFALGFGSYGFKRATIDNTGAISEKWNANYRITGALQGSEDYTDFYKERHNFISPAISFQPTKTTMVDIDYETGTQKQNGVGFQRVRAMTGVSGGDQGEHADFYTLPGTNRRTFRWSGPDTYQNSSSDNFRAQIDQRLIENMHLLVGYNRSSAEFNRRDVGGNLVTNSGPVALRKTVDFGFSALSPAGDSNLNVVNGLVDNVSLRYGWNDTKSEIVHDQVRAELNYKFKMFEDNPRKWLKMDHSILLAHTEETQFNSDSTFSTKQNFSNYKSPLDNTPIRFGTQGDGTPDIAMDANRDSYSYAWDQANYGVYMGKLLNDRITIVSGMRTDRTDNFNYTHNSRNNTSSTKRSIKVKNTTKQNGISVEITPHISAFALKAEGIQPNFSGGLDVNGNAMPPVIASSKEYGLKFDLMDGRISGSISKFKIVRNGTPLSYWWAPTSNDIKFLTNRDLVFRIDDFRPVSLGGPTWTNQAGSADMGKWDAAVAAGAIYQATNSAGESHWYVNGTKATGAAWLNGVFDYTKSHGFSWPGWLYSSDNLTNNSFDDIAAAKSESVIGTDESSGYSLEVLFRPNDNFQLLASYAHVNRIITSAGHFAKYPQSNPWAVWFFPNTDWGLTGKPLNVVYSNPSDTSSWTGIGYGSGEKQDDTPEHAVNVWSNYVFTDGRLKGFSCGVGGQWESPREYQSGIAHGSGARITDKNGNILVLKTKARLSVNALLKYNFNWGKRPSYVQLNVENLLDDQKRYGLIFAAPRSMHLEFSTKL